MKKKIITISLICIIIFASILPVYAENSTDYRNKINNANTKIEKLDGQIDAGLQEVEDLNDKIKTAQNEINKLEEELKQLEKSIKEKTQELKEKKQVLEDRMVAMYIDGETTYLDVLLSGGFVDFVSNYYMVTQMVQYDTNLINEVEKIKTSLEENKAQVETKKQEKVDKQNSLKTLKDQKQAKVDALSKEQKDLQSQVDSWNVKMKELEAEERRAAQAGGKNVVYYNGGALQWPAPSSQRITSYYGYRVHPIFKTYSFHSGIDIGASSGSNIIAAESGTVLLASYGWNGGYGNYIIINHGNGVTTRYAHCSSLGVSAGQTVSRGQVIGAVGSTGNSTGPHLHFEVRMNGNSQDPLSYL